MSPARTDARTDARTAARSPLRLGLALAVALSACEPAPSAESQKTAPSTSSSTGAAPAAASSDTQPPAGGTPLPEAAAPAVAPTGLGLGRAATEAEIAAWDIDVHPSGEGLPEGSGDVALGKSVYATQCVACHGPAGEGGIGPQLIGREPRTGFGEAFKDRPRTIGNYWPYATTLFDYMRRAMPQYAPGTLTDAQVYGLSAYLLAENGIVGADFVADKTSLPAVKMGQAVEFVMDDREAYDRVR